MRKGKHKLYVWPDVEADGKNETSTPSKLKTTSELDRLERLVKKHDAGDIQPVDWLDALAFRQIEKIHKVHRERIHLISRPSFQSYKFVDIQEETEKSHDLHLYIDFPKFDFPLVYGEMASAISENSGRFSNRLSPLTIPFTGMHTARINWFNDWTITYSTAKRSYCKRHEPANKFRHR
jgi:Phosphoinositide 3-kinase C2